MPSKMKILHWLEKLKEESLSQNILHTLFICAFTIPIYAYAMLDFPRVHSNN